MKHLLKTLTLSLFAALIIITAPAADAALTPLFSGLEFREADGFYTVIVDLSGTEYRFDGILDISDLEQQPEILSIASYHICYGDTVVMDVTLREMESAESDPDITGTVGSVLTNGYYAVTFDIDAEYEAFLTGLTLDNLQAVQLELINSVLSDTTFNMENLDFIDTEKIEWGGGDNQDLCWAAACSNILHYTGWAQKAGLNTPDDVFEVYIDAFSPEGGNVVYGIPWFFGGINAKQGSSGWSQADNTEEYAYGEFNGFLPNYAVDNFFTGYYLRTDPQDIEKAFSDLRGGSGIGISLGWYASGWTRSGGHAITLWGYIQKKNASGFDKNDYYALIVSDSDSDDGGYDDRRDAPNELWMLTMTPVVTSQGYDSWQLNGYNTSLYALLENFYALEPYSDEHSTETAESANKFDGVATDIIPYIAALCGENVSGAFAADDSITLRFGAENATQFSWSESRTVTVSYRLTNNLGVTLDEYTANGTLTLSSGGAQFFKKTVDLPAGEYTFTVTVSMADASYTETYYSNNTASYHFTVVDVPELTLSAVLDNSSLTADISVGDASGLTYFDLFELSVSYLQNDVWSDWTTVSVSQTIPASCTIAPLGTQVKFRLEAECGGIVSHSFESEPVVLNSNSTHTLADGGDLRALLASNTVANGDTIVLLGTGFVNDTNSDSAPWVIDKAVTIRGGTVDLRSGGILLGADVTFDGVTLAFGNRVRNAILANGHTLTLIDVQQSSSANAVHLFCGGLTGHTVSATAGTHGTIVITGSTSLGNIYAGSMSSDGAANSFSLPASVIVENGATGQMGAFFACGALETPVDPDEMLNPDYVVAPPAANTALFPVTGAVSVTLYQGVVKNASGLTGGSENAAIVFYGNGNLCTLTMTDLGSLTVQSGHLAPENSSFSSGANVSVASEAMLNLAGFGSTPIIADYFGGGNLVLGETQTLTITGIVSGTTAVGIGGIFNGASEGAVTANHVYISAAASTDQSFVLLPPQSDSTAVFSRDESGNWTVSSGTASIIISSASTYKKFAAVSGIQQMGIPITIAFASDLSFSYLSSVPVAITVNGVAAELCEDEYGYYYTFPEETGLGEAMFFCQDETTEVLTLFAMDSSAIPDGVYDITITIPASYMQSGEALVLKTKLTVGEQAPESDPNVVASGECGENLTWVLTVDGTFTISGTGAMYEWADSDGVYDTPWAEYADSILRAVIDDGATTLCCGLFYSCANLTSVIIPESVTAIGCDAFYGCSSLVCVYYYGTKTQWGAITIYSGNTSLLNAEILFRGVNGLEISANADGTPTLTWEEDWTGADSYEIWRMTDSGTFELIATVTGTTFTDESAAPGTMYFYTVRAVYEDGWSSFSDIVVYFEMRRTPLGKIPD